VGTCREGKIKVFQRLQHREARRACQHVPGTNPPGVAFRSQNRLQKIGEAGILPAREVLSDGTMQVG
jgi:hypothetical protein